jgi:hypothetical protein
MSNIEMKNNTRNNNSARISKDELRSLSKAA